LSVSQIKQLLTDGAGYIMSAFDVLTFDEQGVYDAVEKLGSLVARIILAPLEESAYVHFTRNIDRTKSAGEQEEVSKT
jgi:oligosaccharide translocation protein RFT1